MKLQQEVIASEELLITAIEHYRRSCKMLMCKLAAYYSLDIEKQSEYRTLVARSNIQIPFRGRLCNEWSYVFHGSQCGFHHRSGQSVEVELGDEPNFRIVEPWFLKEFMTSTPQFKQLGRLSWQDLKGKLQTLYLEQKVDQIEDTKR